MTRHALIVGLVILGVARSVAADPRDHLRCHKVRGGEFVRYGLDLDAGDPGFGDAGCQVVGRMRLACVAVSALDVHTLASPPALPPHPERVGPPLEVAYTCYKLRCPHEPETRPVSDAFQSDLAGRFRTDLLCMPAEVGPPTTTTTTLPPACADAATCADGTCPAGEICGNIGGACGCVPRPTPLCGAAEAPACSGTCPDDYHCTQASVGSICTCVLDGASLCGDVNAPACDGACAPNAFCLGGDTGPCICFPYALLPCGTVKDAPACQGSCPANAPICRDVGGTCVCATS
jgi:hypothetical protein